MRLDYVIEGYWLARRRDFSDNTFNDYDLTFRRLVEHLGPAVHFETITSDEVHTFLNQYAHLAKKTRSNIWTALSSLWTWAETDLGTVHVIRGKVKRPKVPRPLIQPFSDEEVLALIDACEMSSGWDTANGRRVRSKRPTAKRDRAMMLVMLDSGVRVSELCALTVGNYTMARGQVEVVDGKGEKDRMTYLGKAAQRALWRYLAEREDARLDDPIFVNGKGQPMDRHSVRKIITRAGERAGVAGASPHRFRHTFAVNYLRNGGNTIALQQLLGHERADTVMIYAEMAAVDLQDSMRRASPADKLGL